MSSKEGRVRALATVTVEDLSFARERTASGIRWKIVLKQNKSG